MIATRLPKLTPREKEVTALIVDGKMNKEIASKLNISIKTVERHRTNAYEKLGVHSTVQLVRVMLGLPKIGKA